MSPLTKQRLEQLAKRCHTRIEKRSRQLLDWTYAYRELRIGGQYQPFSLDGHEYLRELYEQPWPHQVLQKAAQMGASEWALSRALYGVETLGQTVLYLFPTDTEVEDFSNLRVRPAIERVAYLRDQCHDINNVHMRKIGDGVLLLRGMQSKRRVKSVPCDVVIFDEMDECPIENMAQARERLSHSVWGWQIQLSTPTLPGRGIDIAWQESDQRYWHVACGCREGIVLEDVFPDCIAVRNEGTTDEDVYLYCPQCGRERLNVCEPAVVGEYRGWIPKRPEVRELRGYHLSQLYSPVVTTRTLWREYRLTRDIAEFHNSKLGLPYAGDRIPLTDEILARCHGDWGLEQSGRGVWIGIDQGDELHLTVLKPDPNTGGSRLIYAVVLEGRDAFQMAINICGLYEEPTIVIDAMPNKNDARRLCEAYPGRAFMCYYSEQQKDVLQASGDDHDTDAGLKVTANRTETLDRVVDGFLLTAQGKDGGIRLPHHQLPICSTLISHLTAIAKLKRKQLTTLNGARHETGHEAWVYVHTRPDHFAHAINYALIAGRLNVHDDYLGFL